MDKGEMVPILLVTNGGEVEPCRCGRIFPRDRIDYRHGPGAITREAVDAGLAQLRERGYPV